MAASAAATAVAPVVGDTTPSVVVVQETQFSNPGAPLMPPEEKRSWKEICAVDDPFDRLVLDPVLFEGKVQISFSEGTPCISFAKSIIDSLAGVWKNSLIFRPLGARFKLDFMNCRVKDIMNISGKFKLSDLARGYFLLRLHEKSDFDAIFSGGPYSVFGHYLAVKKWTPEFDPLTDTIVTTPVWIRLLNLPILFYEETTLTHIASSLGEPIRVDTRTLYAERSRYARVCVHLDLSRPLPNSIIVEGHELALEFEHLGTICESCGLFGHSKTQCPKNSIRKSVVGIHKPNPSRSASLPGGEEDRYTSDAGWRTKVGKRWVWKPAPATGDSSAPPPSGKPPDSSVFQSSEFNTSQTPAPNPPSSPTAVLNRFQALQEASNQELLSPTVSTEIQHFTPAYLPKEDIRRERRRDSDVPVSEDGDSIPVDAELGGGPHLALSQSIGKEAEIFIDLKVDSTYILDQGIGPNAIGPPLLISEVGLSSPQKSVTDLGKKSKLGCGDSGLKRGFFGPSTRANARASSVAKAPDICQNFISSVNASSDAQSTQKLMKHGKSGARPRIQ